MKSKTTLIVSAGMLAFLLVVGMEQYLKYRQLKSSVGTFAYSVSHARRQLGQEGQYIGQIRDFRWNTSRIEPGDVKGLQPRYLIAREITPGVTEEQWWCSYLFISAPTRPSDITPSDFPPMIYWDYAVR